MAGKFGSSSVWFLVDGYNLLTAKLKALRYKASAVTEPAHGLGDTAEKHDPTGISRFELAQDGGFFDTQTNGAHAALAAGHGTTPQATARVVTFGFAGQTIGEMFGGFEGVFEVAYDVLGQLGNLTKANAAYVVTGQKDSGTILHALTEETAAGNTEASSVDYTADTSQRVIPITSNSIANPTVVTTTVPHGLTTGDIVLIAGVSTSDPTINGQRTVTVISTTTFSVPVNVTTGGTGGTVVRANSANGGAGYLQVTALDLGGYTDAVVKIRDSADNVTFADLITFTAVTAAPDAERKTVTGTVDRYLATSLAFSGAGSNPSITYAVGFARG